MVETISGRLGGWAGQDHTYRKIKIASLARMKLIGLLAITQQPLESLALEIQLVHTVRVSSSWGRLCEFLMPCPFDLAALAE